MGDHFGWLLCDGRLLKKEDYVHLYKVIGSSFGVSGDTHFALPNPAGRVPGVIGSGAGLTTRKLGDISGEEKHTLTIQEMPTHTHDVSGAGLIYKSKMGDSDNTPNGSNLDVSPGEPNMVTEPTNMTPVGGGLAHNVMQPTLFIGNVFIYSGV